LYTRRNERGRVVGVGRARLWHRLGRAGLHAVGPGAGAGAQPAADDASPLRGPRHARPARHRGARRRDARTAQPGCGRLGAGMSDPFTTDRVQNEALLTVNRLSVDYVTAG